MPQAVTSCAVRSYRTISPLPAHTINGGEAVYFLLHFPSAHAPQVLPGTLPCGARTFLPSALAKARLPGRLSWLLSSTLNLIDSVYTDKYLDVYMHCSE